MLVWLGWVEKDLPFQLHCLGQVGYLLGPQFLQLQKQRYSSLRAVVKIELGSGAMAQVV